MTTARVRGGLGLGADLELPRLRSAVRGRPGHRRFRRRAGGAGSGRLRAARVRSAGGRCGYQHLWLPSSAFFLQPCKLVRQLGTGGKLSTPSASICCIAAAHADLTACVFQLLSDACFHCFYVLLSFFRATSWKRKSEKTKQAWPRNAQPKTLREPA